MYLVKHLKLSEDQTEILELGRAQFLYLKDALDFWESMKDCVESGEVYTYPTELSPVLDQKGIGA